MGFIRDVGCRVEAFLKSFRKGVIGIHAYTHAYTRKRCTATYRDVGMYLYIYHIYTYMCVYVRVGFGLILEFRELLRCRA